MSPRAREDRVQVLARDLLLRRSHAFGPADRVDREVRICFTLAEEFVDSATARSEAVPIPVHPAPLPPESRQP